MSTFWKILTGFITGLMLAVIAYFFIMWRVTDGELDKTRAALHNCLNAPVQIDTVFDTIRIHSDSVFKPVPKPKPIVAVVPKPITNDSSTQGLQNTSAQIPEDNQGTCQEWYDQVYRFKGGRFRWKAYIKDCKIEEMSFPEIVAPKEIIYITKIVDTCLTKKPDYYPRTHFGGFLGLAAHDVQTFPGISAGLYVTFQDRLTVQPGVLYINDKLYGSLTFGYKFFTFNK